MSEQYVLAKPIAITKVDDDWFMSDLIYKSDNPGYVSLNKELLDGQFIPLSVREQQIRDILKDNGIEVSDPPNESYLVHYSGKQLDQVIAAILGLESEK